MKITFDIQRKDFYSWAGERLDVLKRGGNLLLLLQNTTGNATRAKVSQEEARFLADRIIEVCSAAANKTSCSASEHGERLTNSDQQSIGVSRVVDGEPFREGVRIDFSVEMQWHLGISADFGLDEARSLAEFLKE